MTEPRDDFADVQQAYRSLPDEPISPELDERVLAMARTALEAKPRSSWLRWSAPIAFAASVLVVVAIVLDPTARRTAEVSRLHEAADRVAPSKATEAPAALPHGVQQDPPWLPAQQDVADSSAEPSGPAKAQQPERSAQARAEESTKEMREEISNARRREATAARSLMSTQYRAPQKARADAVALPPVEREAATAGQQGSLAQAAAEERDAAPSETTPARPIAPVTFPASTPATVAGGAEKVPEIDEIAATSARRGSAGEQRLRDWLYRIHELQVQGKKQEATLQIQALERQYPWLDVQEELHKIRKAEQSSP